MPVVGGVRAALALTLVVVVGCTEPPTLPPLPPADVGPSMDAGAEQDTGSARDVGTRDLGGSPEPDAQVDAQRPDQGLCTGASGRDEIGQACQGPRDCPCWGRCLPQGVCTAPCNPAIEDDCPEGWECFSEPGADPKGLCRPMAEEECNGVDDDSDETTDEGEDGEPLRRACYTGAGGTQDVGECHGGQEHCAEGEWGDCLDEVLPSAREVCDGRDNDCDGATDEEPVEEAPAAALQHGVCADQTKACNGGEWREPDYTAIPGYVEQEQPPYCEDVDNDCDGETDEGCVCVIDETWSCGTDEGECRSGLQRCVEGHRGPCEGAVGPLDHELCNNLDDDCDGATDEPVDLETAPAADHAVGVCAGQTRACEGARGWVEPDYEAIEGFEATETLCDGLDSDCDDATDEALTAPAASLAVGVCDGLTQDCAGAAGWVEPNYEAVEGFEETETLCDGLDNDCDGATDEAEHLLLPEAERCLFLGVCGGTNADCQGEAGWQCGYPAIYERRETLCDDLDNDCDGQTDEELQLGERCGGDVCGRAIWACTDSGATMCTDDLEELLDSDADRVVDRCDNCPGVFNPGQDDQDGDHLGDVCDGRVPLFDPGELLGTFTSGGGGLDAAELGHGRGSLGPHLGGRRVETEAWTLRGHLLAR